jgi:arabinofuranan 3-O-arabinosyltransferase
MNKLLQIEDKIFTELRLSLWGWGAIFTFGFLMVWKVFYMLASIGQSWPILPNGYPRCIDFGFFWLSGKLAVAGDTARIFDFPAWSAIQAAFFDPGSCPNYNRFYYPPTLLFLTYPLGLMPYSVALGVWIVASFTLYLAAVYAIIPRRAALCAAASIVFVMLSNFLMGHNGFFSAALIGLSLVFMERRPVLSGVFLGFLTYKPHFGLLFPIALLASRDWRAIGSAALITAVLAVLAGMAFGYEGWAQFINALTDRSSDLGPAQGVHPRLQSIFGIFYWTGVSPWIAWSVQLAVSVVVALGIWILWAKPISYNLKAAALCAGILLASPYALFYDLSILCIAAAFFIKEGLSRGFLPGERTLIVVFWAVLLSFRLASGPVISAVFLFLIARRIVAAVDQGKASSVSQSELDVRPTLVKA